MLRWDIFCAVIDNYGDVAVSWRLARQLVAEHHGRVRLWVDDLSPLSALCPGINPRLAQQTLHGVEICHWPASNFPLVEIADIVIETFACELPATYVAAMAAGKVKPRWLNLEYLSAEDWVAGCHGLPSPHPRLALLKHFFMPGFSANTGGLLRESDLLQRRQQFQRCPIAQAEFWAQSGCTPPSPALKISLFGYENAALPELLQAWANNPTPIWCVLPNSSLTPAVTAYFGPHEKWQRGNLTVQALPFLSQDRYDQLLWACDLNFVRGEDSLVRALWAGRPLVWHIYPQAEAAHHAKLDAFLSLYRQGLDADSTIVLYQFWQAWNRIPDHSLDWPAWQAIHASLSRHHEQWLEQLIEQTDLATNLVKFTRIG